MKHTSCVVLQRGERVRYCGRVAIIEAVADFNIALIREVETGNTITASLRDLHAYSPDNSPVQDNGTGSAAAPDVKEKAEFRRSVIEPLVDRPDRTRADVEARAKEFGLHANTLYNWLRDFEPEREVSSLCTKERSDKGSKRLAPVVEIIVADAIANLRPEHKTAKQVAELVKDRIENINLADIKSDPKFSGIEIPFAKNALKLPHIHTIESRLALVPRRKTFARLHGEKAAQEKFDPALGHFPGADFPLAIVQIDHTLLDIILVDDVRREPIKRPWITLAYDVFSRTVWGFHCSLDPPGAMSTGLCIAQAILPKEDYLEKMGCTGQWPFWGKPVTIHGDNAFRMGMLKEACHDHGMNLIWRPVKNPRFGGHIESYLGSLGDSIHFLPGTTFSDPKARELYDSEGKACFTQEELEKWLVEKFLAYHAEKHSQLGRPPIERLKQGTFKGTQLHPPVGLQPRIEGATAIHLRLDLMPFELRTIQRYGVEIDKIFYYHDVLRRWINAPDPDHPKGKRKFRFPRFLRNLNSIWFFDPDLREYAEIPTSDPTFPAMSIWELRKVKALAKNEGVPDAEVDEAYIKQRYLRMRELEETAQAKTKSTRTLQERRRLWGKADKPQLPAPQSPASSPTNDEEEFEDVEEFTED